VGASTSDTGGSYILSNALPGYYMVNICKPGTTFAEASYPVNVTNANVMEDFAVKTKFSVVVHKAARALQT
jgi:hypothetical protein